jgi:DNA-binding IclR family transcriptional regulator
VRRPALSASRSLDVIDFLAALPGTSFTMSQIARAINVNVATCHAILNELTARGYLSRSATQKSYTLGPALIGIGNAALKSQGLIERAKVLAEALSREHGVPVALTRLIGEEVVGIFAIPGLGGGRNAARPGVRLPLMAPVGAPFIAWSSRDRIDEWIGRRPDSPDHETVERWHRELERLRGRGFQVLLRSPASGYFPKLLADLAGGEVVADYKNYIVEYVEASDGTMHQLEEIEPGRMYDVMLIAAPIFDQGGQAVYNLCIGDLADQISGETIQELADRLLGACVQIMSEFGVGQF